MTKKDWLKRCENLYDMGMVEDRRVLVDFRNATDALVRLRHVYAHKPEAFAQIGDDHQGAIAMQIITDCGALDKNLTLAADPAYEAVKASAVLAHHCQQCAEDPDAWHTRGSFCPHTKAPSTSF